MNIGDWVFKDPYLIYGLVKVKELDLDVLQGKIRLKQQLNIILKAKMEVAVNETFFNFSLDVNRDDAKKVN
jgi:hypothetical protein